MKSQRSSRNVILGFQNYKDLIRPHLPKKPSTTKAGSRYKKYSMSDQKNKRLTSQQAKRLHKNALSRFYWYQQNEQYKSAKGKKKGYHSSLGPKRSSKPSSSKSKSGHTGRVKKIYRVKTKTLRSPGNQFEKYYGKDFKKI